MNHAPLIIDTVPVGMPLLHSINNWMRLEKGSRIAPPIIDLALAGVEPDGTVIYDSPRNAPRQLILPETLESNFAQGFLEAADFTLKLASLAAVGGLIVYFANDPIKPKKKSYIDALGRAAAAQAIPRHPPFRR